MDHNSRHHAVYNTQQTSSFSFSHVTSAPPQDLHGFGEFGARSQSSDFSPHVSHHSQMFLDPYQWQSDAQHQQNRQQALVSPSQIFREGNYDDAAISGWADGVMLTNNAIATQQNMTRNMVDGKMASVSLDEGFRYQAILDAPTAMTQSPDEIPITYLNKSQVYTISVSDLAPPNPKVGATSHYRTSLRINFDDEDRRNNPAEYWEIWRRRRGAVEARRRGGSLLAVEYIDPDQNDEKAKKSDHNNQMEVENPTLDGFTVRWRPNTDSNSIPNCLICFRFHFLSTDFTHSTGVKGVAMRLCLKTELVDRSSILGSELCFAKVKLFRDHGAERKTTLDIKQAKERIAKIEKQISQTESGMRDVKQENQSGSFFKDTIEFGMDKDDLVRKLQGLQEMLSSAKPVSFLAQRGQPEDDPDYCFKGFPEDGESEVSKFLLEQISIRDHSDSTSFDESSPRSPTKSLTPKRSFSNLQQAMVSKKVYDAHGSSSHPNPQRRPVKVTKISHQSSRSAKTPQEGGTEGNSPSEGKQNPPVACFYVKDKHSAEEYYRAVYLQRRSVKDLVRGISEKLKLAPEKVIRVLHVNHRGLHILIDDNVVRQLPEGQDILVETHEIKAGIDPGITSTLETSSESPSEGETSFFKGEAGKTWEMRLYF